MCAEENPDLYTSVQLYQLLLLAFCFQPSGPVLRCAVQTDEKKKLIMRIERTTAARRIPVSSRSG